MKERGEMDGNGKRHMGRWEEVKKTKGERCGKDESRKSLKDKQEREARCNNS